MDSLSQHGREVIKDWHQFDYIKRKIIYAKINFIRIKDNELKENSTNKHINSHIKYYYK